MNTVRHITSCQIKANAPGILPAVICAVLAAGAQVDAADKPKIVMDQPTSVSLQMGDRPVGRYRYDDIPFKPYLQELRTPSGISILRDSPLDHKHHHSLMFAVAVDGTNFWEETEGCGRQAHLPAVKGKPADETRGRDFASFSQQIAWRAGDKGLMHETRTIRLHRDPQGKANLLSWIGEFRELAPDGNSAGKTRPSVTLSGQRYYGLGMRFITSMDKTGRFLSADGKEGVEGTNDKRSRWCAYMADADGKPVTVAMFDHPGNTRHPATWFTMLEPFSYLCATLGLHHEPLPLGKAATQPAPDRDSTSFRLSYGVAVWDGRAAPGEIERVYALWTAATEAAASAPAN